jgi:serine/threonine protein kinase
VDDLASESPESLDDGVSVDFESGYDPGSIAESEGMAIHPAQPEALDAHRFQVARIIGTGGMGRVELVHDRRLLRDIAWKRGDARLLREARILAQLEHPGIVPVHDMGFGKDGEAFFAMRVVRGRSLAEILRGADCERRAALARSLQRAAEAVAYAHHRGVVHRDLKPANIMIGDFGEAQVVDWGLATVLAEADDPIPEGVRRALAGFETGRAGTPGFMSPEQEQGLAADRRSDVFGLGKILERIFTPGGLGATSAPSDVGASPRAAPGQGVARGCARPPSW